MYKFNFFYSMPFWIVAISATLLFRFLDRQNKLTGKWFLIIASTFMILSIPSVSVISLVVILCLSLITFICGSFLNKATQGPNKSARKIIAGLGIGIVLLFLAFFKYRFIQEPIAMLLNFSGASTFRFLSLIGVSYFSFKMIHFLIESYRAKIENLSFVNYLSYILFFAPFISGPINRYNHFSRQLCRDESPRLKTNFGAAFERIIHGLFKKIVLAQILFPHILGNHAKPVDELSIFQLVLGLYAYALYFYFDFAGYSDLAIGVGRLLGFELPENFNNPFLKRNIRELWANWHMSLTSWLVDYIYWPIVRGLRNTEFFRRHPVFLSNIGMIVTFIVCGMWHGEAFHFIVWGAYHGLGIAALTIYQREKRKMKNNLLVRYFRSRISLFAGVLLTFNYFAIGLAFFVLDMAQLQAIAQRIFQ